MTTRFFSAVLFFTLFSTVLLAQNKNGEVHIPEKINFPNIKISEVSVEGNKLTKNQIITRELDFKLGDTLAAFAKGNQGLKRFTSTDSSEVELRLNYSRDNIINTKLFLNVDIYLEQIQGDNYKIKIVVSERHYWWIFPVVKLNAPNFNEWLRDIDLSQLSMGLFGSHNNLFGSSHQASIAGYVGPSWAIALGYRIPWIGHGQKKGITFVGGYNNLAVVEYASFDNRRQMLYVDNSFESAFLGAQMNFRPSLYQYTTLKVTTKYVSVSDSLFALNPNFLAGNKTENLSMNLYVDHFYDSRNNKSYPLEGNLMRVFIDKRGLGIYARDVDIFYYGIDFHFYQKINQKFYVAEMVKAVNSAGEDQPYYYQLRLNDKKDFIRGYDLYTIKGDQIYFFRSNLKYELVKPNIRKVDPNTKGSKFRALQYAFYLNLLSDAGYVTNKFTEDNPLNNNMLYSWGAGLDFVTYYDMVFRFEYVFNNFGTKGFFIGFGMPV